MKNNMIVLNNADIIFISGGLNVSILIGIENPTHICGPLPEISIK